MSSFSELVLQEKLSRLTSSQESIETLSLWIIHHKGNAETIAQKWSENFLHGNDDNKHHKLCVNFINFVSFFTAQLDKRLVLFYLLNDVLQNSRRKNIAVFVEIFENRIKEAITLVR